MVAGDTGANPMVPPTARATRNRPGTPTGVSLPTRGRAATRPAAAASGANARIGAAMAVADYIPAPAVAAPGAARVASASGR